MGDSEWGWQSQMFGQTVACHGLDKPENLEVRDADAVAGPVGIDDDRKNVIGGELREVRDEVGGENADGGVDRATPRCRFHRDWFGSGHRRPPFPYRACGPFVVGLAANLKRISGFS
jgi:hypothetical protein